ncbi:cytosolic phospholipase A2 epsilon-like isoform X2 [Pseudonaja textilis]|uniref:cytosolic phospholipase A2 epsilon-like isoform X2 n=1 Tax=Pseudonaja textilis TaxID=8673 RepID=UPI000EA9D226|nr:cytosolic phospholipase A2 epsilon-like isoform X2 [Pseudonaja textilis]
MGLFQSKQQTEPAPCSLLTVKIIKIKNLRKADLLTQSDCYVSLYLPTASVKRMKTQTIKDSKDPVWNETFHFRIQNKVKNILEFNVYDEDKITEDDHLLTVMFDVSKIQLGETVPLSFQLNPKGKEELEVEFTMESCPDVPEKILTNGVLVSREVACLEVQVNGGRRKGILPERTFTLSVSGSYEEAENLTLGYWLCPASPAKFHYIKYHQSDLNIEFPRRQFCAISRESNESTTIPLNSLPINDKVMITPVPVVAMTTTGAGMRALTALYGTLWGLQRTKLLDCISYITGSSGTTWTMTKLYEDSNWSNKDLGEIILQARKQAAKSKRGAFSLQNLKSYHKELAERTIAGYKSSFIDLWGLMIEAMLNNANNHHKLSEQRRAVNKGQNPLPIYLALNVKDNLTTKDFREWLEFTPYEVGFPKYGAFVPAEDFGSEFYMGRIMKKLPESRICFMQGLWSSVFSKNLLDAWHEADNSEDFWNRWTQDTVTEIDEVPDILERPHEMPTRMFTPAGGLSSTLRGILTDRPAVSKYNNFLKGFQMHNEYVQHQQFTKWKDTMLDESPNQLKDSTDHLELVDTAFFFDTSCPPLLRPERKVDVILHFNYTGGSQTKPLEHSSTYFSAQGIPFPKVVLSEEEKKNLKECYVFEDTNNPEAPILLYFPLVNDTFQRYIAPGIERNAAQLPQGNVDVSSAFSPYSTRQVSLQEEEFNKLLNLTNYNVQNNANTILRVLHKVVEQKKQAQLSQSSS